MAIANQGVGDRLLTAAPAGAATSRRVRRLLLLGPVVIALGIELGGLAAVNSTISDAVRLRAAHDFAGAIAAYQEAATRTGPAFLLARSSVDAAPADAQRTFLEWAGALAAAGRTDEALVACDRVTRSELAPTARRERAQIALDAARAAASSSRYDTALRRLDQLLAGRPPADLAAAAAGLRPAYGLEAGRALLADGDPGAAVRAFDEVLAQDPAGTEAAAATRLLPGALLAAGQQAIDSHDHGTALADLQRVTADYPSSPQSAQARTLLGAAQPVTGTLVRRDGSPVAGVTVRLGSHYRRMAGSYVTSAPFYFATTDARGDFDISAVPIGGPYTLEVRQFDGWTTIVTADNQPAYQVTINALSPVDLAFVVVPA